MIRTQLWGKASKFCQLNNFSSACEYTGGGKLPGDEGVRASSRAQADLHSDFRELFLGEVQRMVDSSDPIFLRGLASPQVSSKDCSICYIKETNHSMPAFIVKPHLKESESIDSFKKPSLITLSCRRKFGCLYLLWWALSSGKNPSPGIHSS